MSNLTGHRSKTPHAWGRGNTGLFQASPFTLSWLHASHQPKSFLTQPCPHQWNAPVQFIRLSRVWWRQWGFTSRFSQCILVLVVSLHRSQVDVNVILLDPFTCQFLAQRVNNGGYVRSMFILWPPALLHHFIPLRTKLKKHIEEKGLDGWVREQQSTMYLMYTGLNHTEQKDSTAG